MRNRNILALRSQACETQLPVMRTSLKKSRRTLDIWGFSSKNSISCQQTIATGNNCTVKAACIQCKPPKNGDLQSQLPTPTGRGTRTDDVLASTDARLRARKACGNDGWAPGGAACAAGAKAAPVRDAICWRIRRVRSTPELVKNSRPAPPVASNLRAKPHPLLLQLVLRRPARRSRFQRCQRGAIA